MSGGGGVGGDGSPRAPVTLFHYYPLSDAPGLHHTRVINIGKINYVKSFSQEQNVFISESLTQPFRPNTLIQSGTEHVTASLSESLNHFSNDSFKHTDSVRNWTGVCCSETCCSFGITFVCRAKIVKVTVNVVSKMKVTQNEVLVQMLYIISMTLNRDVM